MKVAVDAQNRQEADAIRTAMSDPATRAMVIITGVLMQLPSDRARLRVLAHVKDCLDEQREQPPHKDEACA